MTPSDAAFANSPQNHSSTRVPASALRFAFARSSGPGGQNVNKRSTKCLMWVSVGELTLSPPQRARLIALAGPSLVVQGEKAVRDRETSELDDDDVPSWPVAAGRPPATFVQTTAPVDPHAALLLLITSTEHRSQERNREACVERLHELVLRCLVPPKPRKATKPSRAAKQRRLTDKKQQGERKRNRRDKGE
jgi:ribosome-associated protein